MKITSPANPRIKSVVRLGKKKERLLTGLMAVEGIREISRAAAAGVVFREAYFCPETASGRDSEKLLARLAMGGGVVGAPADEADIVLVNTCGFIAPARAESLEVIEGYLSLKADEPHLRVLVLGCLAEREGQALREALPGIDGIFGLGEHDAIAAACGLSGPSDEEARLLLTPPHTAYLRVSEGCDHGCTYCTIPSIRGPFRSRTPLVAKRD